MARAKATKEKTGTTFTFLKDQIIGSERYKNRRDVLDAILPDNKPLTLEEVDAMLDEFMKEEVI